VKISSRIRREEFKPIPKGYTHNDFLVEMYQIKEPIHFTELISDIYAEADA